MRPAPLTEDQVAQVVQELNGTCETENLGDILGVEYEDMQITNLDQESIAAITQQIERCDGCSWWMDRNELDDDLMCSDCQ